MLFALVACAVMLNGETSCQKQGEFKNVEACVLAADEKMLKEMAYNFNEHANLKALSVMCTKFEPGTPA